MICKRLVSIFKAISLLFAPFVSQSSTVRNPYFSKMDDLRNHMELVHCAPDDSSLSVNNSHQNVNPPVPFRCLQWFNQRIQVRRPPYRACVHSVVWINCHSPGGLGNSLVLKIREGAGLLQEDGHLGGICICSSLLLRPPYHPNHGQQVGLLQKLQS